jgi:RecB family endonuclease NucS
MVAKHRDMGGAGMEAVDSEEGMAVGEVEAMADGDEGGEIVVIRRRISRSQLCTDPLGLSLLGVTSCE